MTLWPIAAAASLALTFAGCAALEPTAFYDLGLAGIGLDYPHSRQQLTRCKEARDASCLKAHERVKLAKSRLFEAGRRSALQSTADTIAAKCAAQQADMACVGALIALNFFTTAEDDNTIRSYLGSADGAVIDLFITIDLLWLSARADRSTWQPWLAATPTLTDSQRSRFVRGLAANRQAGLTIDEL